MELREWTGVGATGKHTVWGRRSYREWVLLVEVSGLRWGPVWEVWTRVVIIEKDSREINMTVVCRMDWREGSLEAEKQPEKSLLSWPCERTDKTFWVIRLSDDPQTWLKRKKNAGIIWWQVLFRSCKQMFQFPVFYYIILCVIKVSWLCQHIIQTKL